MNTFPFEISRQNRISLFDQVTDGLRSAIITGHFQAGDRLPNLHEMAAALDVSEIVTRRAIQRLTREGLVNPRRGTGTVVCGSDLKTWRGHVLYMTWSGPTMYYQSVLSSIMTERLHAANVLVSMVHLDPSDPANALPKIKAELSHAITLAVVEGGIEGIDSILTEKNIPFIHLNHVDSSVSPNAVQGITIHRETVFPSLRDHCLACGIRHVLQLSTTPVSYDLEPILRASGITVETLFFEHLRDFDKPERVERGAMTAMQSWLAGKPKLPDLIWFCDDFAARGALLVLTSHGIRIPEDVQVISWANKGLGPVFLKPLTRVEMDPKAHGETVAQCILDKLNNSSSHPIQVALTPTFVVGETTRHL